MRGRRCSYILRITAVLLTCFAPRCGASDTTAESRKLHALFAREWDWTMEQFPTWASTLGDRRWNDRWDDVSLAAIENRQSHRADVAAELKSIDRAALTAADQLNYDLFAADLQRQSEGHQFQWHLIPLDQRDGVQTAGTLAESLRFQTAKDYQDFIARMRAFPHYVDQTIALMREGIRRHMVHPRVVMTRVPGQVIAQIVEDAAKSDWYKPFLTFPTSIPESDREKLSSDAADAIRTSIVPSYRSFLAFFEKEYLPACTDQVGIWQLPRGGEMYAFFARRHTTTEFTPDQIHALGLSEVKRIDAEMDRVMRSTGFKGTRDEFFTFLRTDPRFFYTTGDDLLAATRALCKRVDPKLVKLFATLPRTPYGVEPIPMSIAPDTTTAYYNEPAADGSRAGTYYVNLYKPETRPKWEMTALALHESVPGHHLQIARAQELPEMPMFRKMGHYTAFVEGWGLYAESLGEELGLYDDPYSRFGQLTYEMWRAVRLVVDTGIHHKRWTRQQAIDYFKQHTPRSELDITNEVDRYIAWPGQALAYKIGELKIKELRARASKELGEKFDVKAFHDVILGSGAVPLDVLERNVTQWIAQKGSR